MSDYGLRILGCVYRGHIGGQKAYCNSNTKTRYRHVTGHISPHQYIPLAEAIKLIMRDSISVPFESKPVHVPLLPLAPVQFLIDVPIFPLFPTFQLLLFAAFHSNVPILPQTPSVLPLRSLLGL